MNSDFARNPLARVILLESSTVTDEHCKRKSRAGSCPRVAAIPDTEVRKITIGRVEFITEFDSENSGGGSSSIIILCSADEEFLWRTAIIFIGFPVVRRCA